MRSANLISPSDDEDDAYIETRSRRPKRRKTSTGKAVAAKPRATRVSASLPELQDAFRRGLIIRAAPESGNGNGNENKPEIEHQNKHDGFESTMEGLLAEYLEARQALWTRSSCAALPEDNKGPGGTEGGSEHLRPLSRLEIARILALGEQHVAERTESPLERVVLRKLRLLQERRKERIRESPPLDTGTPTTLTPLDVPPSEPVPHAVLDALRAIHTTQYEHSFAARVYGHAPQNRHGLISVDWESHPPWLLLMDDVHAFYSLAHPERDWPERLRTPITYVTLQQSHLNQVHDLLARVFWDGIDVSDALHHTPERSTVIATYGHLVVGAALLSSPQETYITYLAVRAGWDNAQIATTMLYHLISLHPYRDITLHVSANNPAMLLYNRFGFKAEEFITGFYDAYLDTRSKASKNAFLLRLRR